MCRCFETIRVEDGRAHRLEWHQRRVEATRKELFPSGPDLVLRNVIPADLPEEGLHRLRVVYSREVESVTVEPYLRRSIRSLACVDADNIDYHRKWTDRGALDARRASRPDVDDVILVQHGFVTDSSYSNLAFWDGRVWWTPHRPLLEGTARARLIAEGVLVPCEIRVDELARFELVSLINALNDPGDIQVPISAVRGLGM